MGTRHQPHCQDLHHIQNGGQTRRKTISYWTQAKITVRYKKVVKYSSFSLLVYHFMALTFPVNSPFVFNKFIIYFLSERFFPKNRKIESHVGRPWEMTKHCETHGMTVRVGRSAVHCRRQAAIIACAAVVLSFPQHNTYLRCPERLESI